MLILIFLSILGLAGVVTGAAFLVNDASTVARRVHVSEFVIGMVIVGVGTSLPELLVSFFGAMQGSGDVAIGNVVGSNIFNVLLILGLTMFIKPVRLAKCGLMADVLICLATSLVLYLMAFGLTTNSGGSISRIEGGGLLLMFAAFLWYSLKAGRNEVVADSEKSASTFDKADDNIRSAMSVNGTATGVSDAVEKPLWQSLAGIGAGLVLLIFGARLFVDKAVELARMFNVSESFIAITLLAGGTSLPELAVSVTAAVKGNNDIALGNIVGSNIFNIMLILGLCSVVTPLSVSGVGPFDMAVMIYAVLLLMWWVAAYKRREVPRWQSLLMLASYAAYICLIS